MSFSSLIKTEISKLEIGEIERIAELSAIICSGAQITEKIKIATENASVARRVFELIKERYLINPSITVRKGTHGTKKNYYILEITNKNNHILNDLGLYDKVLLDIPKLYILDDEESIRSYLRGLFLMAGSINDPKKSRYHLEFLVNSKVYAEYIKKLLNSFNLNSRVIKRDNKYMIYIKEAEKIGDFLRIISAHNAVLYFEDIRIYRDHKNMTNRLNNCEQANVERIIDTASNQVKDIELIEKQGGLDLLDDKGKIVALYRLKYKEASLTELSEIITIETGNKITKSGLYHRFKKIISLANKIRENKK